MFVVYILQSTKFNQFYIGVTHDLLKRFEMHNRGYSKSTKPYKPWIVIYQEIYDNKQDAYKREFYLKHPKGLIEKQTLIKVHRKNNGEVA